MKSTSKLQLTFNQMLIPTLCEKCLNTEFFLVHIFPYWTEYGDLRSKSPWSVQMRENIDQKKLCVLDAFHLYLHESHWATVWWLLALRLKKQGRYLTCKTIESVNMRVVRVVEKNKDGLPLFLYCLVKGSACERTPY